MQVNSPSSLVHDSRPLAESMRRVLIIAPSLDSAACILTEDFTEAAVRVTGQADMVTPEDKGQFDLIAVVGLTGELPSLPVDLESLLSPDGKVAIGLTGGPEGAAQLPMDSGPALEQFGFLGVTRIGSEPCAILVPGMSASTSVGPALTGALAAVTSLGPSVRELHDEIADLTRAVSYAEIKASRMREVASAGEECISQLLTELDESVKAEELTRKQYQALRNSTLGKVTAKYWTYRNGRRSG